MDLDDTKVNEINANIRALVVNKWAIFTGLGFQFATP